MSAFHIQQNQGVQGTTSYPLPSVAAVDTNFLFGAFIDSDQKKVNALSYLAQSDCMMVVTTKVVDELAFKIQQIGEDAFIANARALRGKRGDFLAANEYERRFVAGTALSVLDSLEAAPYIILDTTYIDQRFSVQLLAEYGIFNADGQVLATALRHGVCDIISDDRDYSTVPNINQWTTRIELTNVVQPAAPVTFTPVDWTSIAPDGFFDSMTYEPAESG